MPPPKQESQRRTRAGEPAAAKQKQMASYSRAPDKLLTTPQGLVIADNHNSLRAGARGPLLAEDFILADKLAHFGRERIPERVIHARGAGAHGYFEVTRPLGEFTRAAFLQEAGGRTPVFVRFSNLTGSAGSADTVRDVRGFAVKFYTAEGNYDLVGQNMPVAFVQDAMKFPDLVHALKPEPHHGMPQASSAHDTFWDFASLLPETTHMLMWLMSGRGLPRSYRMMAGFGVHTFRLVNAAGASHYVKFHWKPRLGCHALVWDEAQKIAGRDPDYLRRDLWCAIEDRCWPEWDLALQLIPEQKADSYGFDLLDPTKLIPEELVPPLVVGKLVLDRNPENYFAETEQVAFHPAHLVPGIDFTSDTLLQGRLGAYTGSQMGRLGGPNYAELPINRAVCPVRSLQRDGSHRTAIDRGVVAYEPHSLAGGAEFRVDGGQQGFQSTAEPVEQGKVRGRSAGHDDHFSQASFFWNSQASAEKDQVVAAFQFELSKVATPAVRQRMVDNLAHVDARLARRVAEPLGIGVPDARAAAGRAGFRELRGKLPLESSAALSMHGAATSGISSRRVAILVAPGVEIGALRAVQQALQDAGASCRVLSDRLGSIATSSGQQLMVDHTMESMPSVLFDAVIVPPGAASVQALAQNGDAVHFVLEAYRHCKTICVMGEGAQLLQALGAGEALPSLPGVVVGSNEATQRAQLAQDFVAAIARHRHWERQNLQSVSA